MAKLYLVGTPIGNLGDFPPRAVQVLNDVDFIAAEDTRVSRKLLTHFGIAKPLVSYHAHNQKQSGGAILTRILNGESCAVVTDAGMPCISDPGEELVQLCAEHGVEIVVVPGPNAAVSAIALSGLPTGRFTFEGFLSVQKGSRKRHLDAIRQESRTMIFYEAPHKLCATLTDLLDTLGDRRIALARELTKLHEEVRRTTLAEAVAYYNEHPPRGEFVLVIEGAPEVQPEDAVTLEDAISMVLARQTSGMALSQAAKEIAALTGLKKGELYRAALEHGSAETPFGG